MIPEQDSSLQITFQILSLLGLIYTIYIIFVSLYKRSDTVSKILQSMTIIHVLCYSIRFITFLISATVTTYNIAVIFWYVSEIFWIFGVVTFYSIIIKRLQMTFKNSIYELSKYQIYFYIILVSIVAPLWGFGCFYAKNYKYIFVFIIAGINAYIGLSVLMIFTNNILKLILSLTKLDSRSYKLDHRQRTLVNTITKNAVLSMFSSLFYEILVIFWGVASLLSRYITKHSEYKFYGLLISNILMSLSIWMEIHCIFLSFKYNDNQYKIMCSLCHNCFYKCFESHATKQVSIEIASIIQSDTHDTRYIKLDD